MTRDAGVPANLFAANWDCTSDESCDFRPRDSCRGERLHATISLTARLHLPLPRCVAGGAADRAAAELVRTANIVHLTPEDLVEVLPEIEVFVYKYRNNKYS